MNVVCYKCIKLHRQTDTHTSEITVVMRKTRQAGISSANAQCTTSITYTADTAQWSSRYRRMQPIKTPHTHCQRTWDGSKASITQVLRKLHTKLTTTQTELLQVINTRTSYMKKVLGGDANTARWS